MLKKAGIVVAAVAAGLLAVSPLAFAGDGYVGKGQPRDHDAKTQVTDSHDCVSTQNTPIESRGSGEQFGLLALVGGIGSVPITVPVQALNCNEFLNDVNILSVDKE